MKLSTLTTPNAIYIMQIMYIMYIMQSNKINKAQTNNSYQVKVTGLVHLYHPD